MTEASKVILIDPHAVLFDQLQLYALAKRIMAGDFSISAAEATLLAAYVVRRFEDDH